MTVWLQFGACAAVILFAGVKLSFYGDIIAEKTGLGRTWVGVVLLASVTSLPELITGISSVALFGVPDIAAGDVLGSCMFNVLIIALLDLMAGPSPLSARAHQGQVLTAGIGILLLGLVAISLNLGPQMPSVGWVGVHSIVLVLLYLGAMRLVFTYEKRRIAEFVEKVEYKGHAEISGKRAYTMYGLNAAFIVAAATYLPHLGGEIARATGLGQSFVGNIIIGASTSLPEIVVSLAALKMGAVDMAFGNLFGSNLFDMAILGIDDVFYTKGVLTSHVAASQQIAAIAAMMMTAVAVVGMTYRVTRKRLFLAWDSWGIVAVYVLATGALYLRR
jgi:cation:H+ antiporter